MKYIIVFLPIALSTCQFCGIQHQSIDKKEVLFNHQLAARLSEMETIDQQAAYPPDDRAKIEEWSIFQDSVFIHHCLEMEHLFNQYGYPGYTLVGEDGARSFWLMTQHCDHNSGFQEKVLEQMEYEVNNKNADPRHFGLLTDRLRINKGQKQRYGTQVMYNELKQAIPKPLEDSLNVDERRAEIGLEPIKEYLNRMTISHFNMNKENFAKKGILKPKLH